jgi:hypothetical protein
VIALLAIALLGQVPDSVTQTGTKLLEQGGFQAVTAVLGAMTVALGVVAWRLYQAVREMSTKLLEFATRAVDQAAQSQAAQREQTAAMNALALEVRARGEGQRASG